MKDKKQHILAGLAVAVVVGFLTYLLSGEDSSRSLAAGIYATISSTFAAACVKEYCDKGYSLDPTSWDWRDIGFTMIGAAIVAVFIVLLHFAKG